MLVNVRLIFNNVGLDIPEPLMTSLDSVKSWFQANARDCMNQGLIIDIDRSPEDRERERSKILLPQRKRLILFYLLLCKGQQGSSVFNKLLVSTRTPPLRISQYRNSVPISVSKRESNEKSAIRKSLEDFLGPSESNNSID